MTDLALEVDGVPFTNFKSFSISRSMDTFSGAYSFTASDADKNAFPIKLGSFCRATINGFPILSGYVEVISPNVSATSHDVTIQGRDITADVLDSTLSAGQIELQPPISLEAVIAEVLFKLGLAGDIGIENEVKGLADFTEEDLVSVKAGDGAFNFLEKYARKRQVLLSSDGDGNIVITRNSETPIDNNFRLLNRRDGSGNNIKSSSSKFDNSERFNQYIVQSQGNPLAANNFGIPDLAQISGTENQPVIDDEIRFGRQLVIVAEKASSPEQCRERALWEANIRKARSRTYTATIEGIVIPGTDTPYPVNRLVQVQDGDASISATMLIKSIDLTFATDGGSITKFALVNRDAFTLQIEEPKQESRTNPIAAVFDKARALGIPGEDGSE